MIILRRTINKKCSEIVGAVLHFTFFIFFISLLYFFISLSFLRNISREYWIFNRERREDVSYPSQRRVTAITRGTSMRASRSPTYK